MNYGSTLFNYPFVVLSARMGTFSTTSQYRYFERVKASL